MTDCTVRTCRRPAKWLLVTTNLSLASCSVHLDPLTTHVSDRTGAAPVQRPIRPVTPTPQPAQTELF